MAYKTVTFTPIEASQLFLGKAFDGLLVDQKHLARLVFADRTA
jgi:hypothetical protein